MVNLLIALCMLMADNPDNLQRYVSIEDVIAYSSKDGMGYSSKDSKSILDLPESIINPLDRMYYPNMPPVSPIIHPPQVTDVNP